jgi:hypothetical protein
MTPFEEMKSYLGKEVWVRLSSNDEPPVSYTGVLLALEDTGQIALRMDDGFSVYCWPALEMRLVNPKDREEEENKRLNDDSLDYDPTDAIPTQDRKGDR